MTAIDKHVAGTVSWVDLMTKDAEAARTFYAGLFGWSFEVGGPEMGHYAIASIAGKPVAGLGPQSPGAEGAPSAWTVYFATDDLDATAAKVREHGGNVMMPPMDVMEEGRLAVFTDPTGAHFGAWQARRHTGAKLVDQPGTMCWREVATTDVNKARDFYIRVFGLEPKPMSPEEAPPTEY